MIRQPFEQSVEKPGLPEASPERQALEMLEAFASVGATRFALTVKREGEKKPSFRPDCPLEQLRPTIGVILRTAAERQKSVIVRPLPAQAFLIQLDDLDAAKVARVQPAAFLVLCTSPGSYQAWVAVCDGDEAFARRLKKGIGADVNASGATRVGGSLNCKAEHGPHFPRVETVHVAAGLTVRKADLEALGVAAPAPSQTPTKAPPCGSVASGRPKRFPDYQRCLRGAPEARSHRGRDRSQADFLWCCQALEWGWREGEVSAELLRVSAKAREKGESYVLRTVAAALRKKRTTGGGP